MTNIRPISKNNDISSLCVGATIYQRLYSRGAGTICEIDDKRENFHVVFHGGGDTWYSAAYLQHSHHVRFNGEIKTPEEVANLLAKVAIYNANQKAAEGEEKRRFDAEIERLKSASEYAHLAQFGRTAFAVEVAKNMRKHLKKTFPLCKFSVKTSRGVSSVRVSWTDGPTQEAVTLALVGFKGGNFGRDSHGNDDIYEYVRTPFNSVFGAVEYISADRAYSDDQVQVVIDALNETHKLEMTVEQYRNGGLWNVDIVGQRAVTLIYQRLEEY